LVVIDEFITRRGELYMVPWGYAGLRRGRALPAIDPCTSAAIATAVRPPPPPLRAGHPCAGVGIRWKRKLG
jgi:hypothetical protein